MTGTEESAAPAGVEHALAAAAATINEIREGELADERPRVEQWNQEIAGLRRLLSAAADLMVVIGNGCPLYVVQARWRDGSRPPPEGQPSTELMAAGGEILEAREALHDPLMQLHGAQMRLAKLTFDHDQPSIWTDPI